MLIILGEESQLNGIFTEHHSLGRVLKCVICGEWIEAMAYVLPLGEFKS